MDKIKCLLNMIIALIKLPFCKSKFKDKNIWLIGGHAGDLYDDKSKYFYEYILDEHKDIDIYWVINENSKCKNQVKGKYLIKGSVENYLYYYNASVIIFSHAPSADIAPYNFVIPGLNYFHKRVLKVFLNHGAISFKKRKPMNKALKNTIEKLMQSYDISTAISQFEKDIMVNEWNMDKDKVFILGNPRYDELPLNENIESSEILYTPTWRDWIKSSSDNFIESDYFKNIMSLLNDEKLNKFLEERDINIKFYMHHLMHEFIDDIKSNITGKRVIFLDEGTALSDEIKKSAMNITDYSGIAMDFLYMNRPILFYQFDVKEYIENVDSYIDLKTEMFGLVAYNKDEAVNQLIETINNNYKVNESQIQNREKFFKYNDNNSCDRIVNCIQNKISK